MESLAASRSRAKGTEVENELKQLRSIEQQRRVARNIKRMQGKLQRNATLQVVVNDDGRHVLTEKEDMEEACITENIARFRQSEDTPPMTEPLVTHLWQTQLNLKQFYRVLISRLQASTTIHVFCSANFVCQITSEPTQ